MSKQVLFHNQAKDALKRGIDIVAQAVMLTLGPRGKNVAIKNYGAPMITNDGVSIAKDITLKDKFEDMGASIIKEVAEKTNDAAGDGTTTSTTLAYAMMTNGLMSTGMGANGVIMRQGIEDATKDAVAILKDMAQPVKGDMIKQVATISAESEELGSIIAETIEKVGQDGVVTVEESQTFGVSSDVVEGMAFDKGYISPYMITSPERMEAEYKNPAILVTDKKITNVKEILPLLERLAQTGKKDMVIIAEDVEGEALATFVVNKLRGAFNVLAVKAPGYGDRRKEMLQDIATVVHAQVVSEETGMKLEETTLDMLGEAAKVVSKKDQTVIVDGKGSKAAIDSRVEQLKTMLSNTKSKFDQEKLQERIAKLAGGVAVIKVGASTETEMKYLKHKIEDAVHATKAAIEEGIVPGGGSALAKTSEALYQKLESYKGSEEAKTGYGIVANALLVPLRQMLINAGRDQEATLITQSVAKGYHVDTKGTKVDNPGLGYNILTEEFVPDMVKAGIIDPVKVTRTALQNAASASAVFLTTEVAIADEPEDDKAAPAMPGGMGMGGGMPGMGMM